MTIEKTLSLRQALREGRPVRKARTGSMPGAMPGALAVDPEAPHPVVNAIGYGPGGLEEATLDNAAELKKWIGRWPALWVNVDGLGDAKTLKKIGSLFGLHPLALEDVVNTHQRAKIEEYDDHLFFVCRMTLSRRGLSTEQLSLFLGKGFVLTFQETAGDCFGPVRKRLRAGRGRICSSGADYLAYALIDAVVDEYMPLLDAYDERLDHVERAILAQPRPGSIGELYEIKRELLTLRRYLWPLRDSLNWLLRDETPLATPETRVYLRDCEDHSIRLLELIDHQRDMAASLLDLHLSLSGARMNEVVQALTMVATVFIPLSFIAGLYGMNFDGSASPLNMPELRWRWGYPFALALMASVAAGMLAFFRRKGWLGSRSMTTPPIEELAKDVERAPLAEASK
jgi:magnesium transporter